MHLDSFLFADKRVSLSFYKLYKTSRGKGPLKYVDACYLMVRNISSKKLMVYCSGFYVQVMGLLHVLNNIWTIQY